jgi:phosphopantetheinyl transferase
MAFTDKTAKFGELEKHTQIWLGRVEEIIETISGIGRWLSDDEKGRYALLDTESLRRSFGAGRVLMKTVLSRYVGAPPHAWRVEADAFGAIHVALRQNPLGLFVNLSRSGPWVACAVSKVPCGLDIEETTRAVTPRLDARGVFTRRERAAMGVLGPKEQVRFFFEHWCLKEAYAKARGVGFHLPPGKIEIQLNGDGEFGVEVAAPDGAFKAPGSGFRLGLFHPAADLVLAAAHDARDGRDRGFELRRAPEAP